MAITLFCIAVFEVLGLWLPHTSVAKNVPCCTSSRVSTKKIDVKILVRTPLLYLNQDLRSYFVTCVYQRFEAHRKLWVELQLPALLNFDSKFENNKVLESLKCYLEKIFFDSEEKYN